MFTTYISGAPEREQVKDDSMGGINCQMLTEVLGESEIVQKNLRVRREEGREGALEENYSFK